MNESRAQSLDEPPISFIEVPLSNSWTLSKRNPAIVALKASVRFHCAELPTMRFTSCLSANVCSKVK